MNHHQFQEALSKVASKKKVEYNELLRQVLRSKGPMTNGTSESELPFSTQIPFSKTSSAGNLEESLSVVSMCKPELCCDPTVH